MLTRGFYVGKYPAERLIAEYPKPAGRHEQPRGKLTTALDHGRRLKLIPDAIAQGGRFAALGVTADDAHVVMQHRLHLIDAGDDFGAQQMNVGILSGLAVARDAFCRK